MKLIKPYFEIIEQESGPKGIYKQIELAGRTCYKSEDKITESSCIEFVQRMINSKHTAMLEHGTVYLKIPIRTVLYSDRSYQKLPSSTGRYNSATYSTTYSNGKYLYVTTNYRVLVDNKWLDDLQYLCESTKFHTKRISVKFVCDRGVSHEIVRHRKFSFAQESTRYCNYSKDKFGNELTFILPPWVNDEQNNLSLEGRDICGNTYGEVTFKEGLIQSEKVYFTLLKEGWKPQQARAVLPNSLKTEIIVTGFIHDWIHFFRLRSNIALTGAPHPQMEELATPLMNEFINLGYITEQDVEVK